MLDSDLAELYNVETRVLNQSAKRNSDRFPEDFMFQLSMKEFEILKSQNATSSWGGRKTIDVFYQDNTLWLPQKTIAELFEKGRSTITEHLKKIFDEGE